MAEDEASSGNFVSEWYGQRIYPRVRLSVAGFNDGGSTDCPFLSRVLRRPAGCVKSTNSAGVCSVSSNSNRIRQDWLVCPYRVIDSDIVGRACQLIFTLPKPVAPIPVSLLEQPDERERFEVEVRGKRKGYLFFQDKLGGEISLLGSDRSPELSFDVTIVEVVHEGASFSVARYGILEIQTMDYHGTYKHAVNNLRDGLRLHRNHFPQALTANLAHWAGQGVEGPNIANVFKRTFYQTLLEFRLAGGTAAAAETLLALPRAVWDSWQPFLGAPSLESDGKSGMQRLAVRAHADAGARANAYMCGFDLASDSASTVSPVRIEHFIRVSPEELAHQAFTVVPDNIARAMQSDDLVVARIRSRLARWWPAFKPEAKPARTRHQSAHQ